MDPICHQTTELGMCGDGKDTGHCFMWNRNESNEKKELVQGHRGIQF